MSFFFLTMHLHVQQPSALHVCMLRYDNFRTHICTCSCVYIYIYNYIIYIYMHTAIFLNMYTQHHTLFLQAVALDWWDWNQSHWVPFGRFRQITSFSYFGRLSLYQPTCIYKNCESNIDPAVAYTFKRHFIYVQCTKYQLCNNEQANYCFRSYTPTCTWFTESQCTCALIKNNIHVGLYCTCNAPTQRETHSSFNLNKKTQGSVVRNTILWPPKWSIHVHVLVQMTAM